MTEFDRVKIMFIFSFILLTNIYYLLTLNVLYHTIPHELFKCEVKDVYGLQSFVSTHSEESGSLLFVHCLL